MAPGEADSMVKQAERAYAMNRRAPVPVRLTLTDVSGTNQERMLRMAPGHPKWSCAFQPGDLAAAYEGRLGDLVYLTADAEEEISELEAGKVYIIGGIVDRNRHKNVCLEKARRLGIATAKLPIQELLPLRSSAVLASNQVVEILLEWLATRDWRAALEAVVPLRKRAGAASRAERRGRGGGGSRGEGAEGPGAGAEAEAGAGGRVGAEAEAGAGGRVGAEAETEAGGGSEAGAGPGPGPGPGAGAGAGTAPRA